MKLFALLTINITIFQLGAFALAQDLSKNQTKAEPPYSGQWQVVSITVNHEISPVSGMSISLSNSFLAEYKQADDRTYHSDLFNVKWNEKEGLYSTRLFANPAKSIGIGKFAEQNTRGYCYLKIRGDSGVILISEMEIKGKDFSIEDIAGMPGKILTVFRTSRNPGKRIEHAKYFVSQYEGMRMDDFTLRSIGGWFELARDKSVEQSKLDDTKLRRVLMSPGGANVAPRPPYNNVGDTNKQPKKLK